MTRARDSKKSETHVLLLKIGATEEKGTNAHSLTDPSFFSFMTLKKKIHFLNDSIYKIYAPPFFLSLISLKMQFISKLFLLFKSGFKEFG
jgi:hypothetical protein